MPPAMKRLLADFQLLGNPFDHRALVELYSGVRQLRVDLLQRVSLPLLRVFLLSLALGFSNQLVKFEGGGAIE